MGVRRVVYAVERYKAIVQKTMVNVDYLGRFLSNMRVAVNSVFHTEEGFSNCRIQVIMCISKAGDSTSIRSLTGWLPPCLISVCSPALTGIVKKKIVMADKIEPRIVQRMVLTLGCSRSHTP